MLLRVAAFAALVSPVVAWLAASALTGTLWLPGSGHLRYALVPFVAMVAFAAFEDLSAVARHRAEDAQALAGLELPSHAIAGPGGVDVVVPSGDGVVAAVVLGADSPVAEERGRHLATSTVRRRGVSMRRLLGAASEIGATPVVVVPACESLDLDVALRHGTVRVVGASQWAEIDAASGLAERPAPATEHAQSAHDPGAETTGRIPT